MSVNCEKLRDACLQACDEECLDLGLDAECRLMYKDCLGNPNNYIKEVGGNGD